MMSYNKRQTRIRRMRRWRDGILEHVAMLVIFALFTYVFFYLPLSRSMGW
jgi:hypothetical protein